jgi:ketosteroid isomerase-like protein
MAERIGQMKAAPKSVHENKAVVRSFVAAWNDKDFDCFDNLMAEDATLTVGGSHAQRMRRQLG